MRCRTEPPLRTRYNFPIKRDEFASRTIGATMTLHDEIGKLSTEFSGMVTELKSQQDRLLSYGCQLESVISERTAELSQANANLDTSIAERNAMLNSANDTLVRQTAELLKRNQEITLFSRMNDFLQTCTTEAEAYSVISETATQLFPGDSGAVFVLNASRDMLEAVSVWGSRPPEKLVFPPGDCWGHRRGKPHVATSQAQRCSHVADDRPLYACLPLVALGETLGILHILDGAMPNDETAEAHMAGKCAVAEVLADNIGLGIANLKLREAMRNLTIRDARTGLFNRRYMEEALALELHRTTRNKAQLAVIMIDIDHFKRFNDSFGHDGGDAILGSLGSFLKKRVRGSDIACRWGGDEFILILSPSTTEGARQRAETIRQDIMLLNVRHADQNLGIITVSMGVAMFPDDASDAATIFKAADVALYRAKKSGRNRVAMHTQAADSTALFRP